MRTSGRLWRFQRRRRFDSTLRRSQHEVAFRSKSQPPFATAVELPIPGIGPYSSTWFGSRNRYCDLESRGSPGLCDRHAGFRFRRSKQAVGISAKDSLATLREHNARAHRRVTSHQRFGDQTIGDRSHKRFRRDFLMSLLPFSTRSTSRFRLLGVKFNSLPNAGRHVGYCAAAVTTCVPSGGVRSVGRSRGLG